MLTLAWPQCRPVCAESPTPDFRHTGPSQGMHMSMGKMGAVYQLVDKYADIMVKHYAKYLCNYAGTCHSSMSRKLSSKFLGSRNCWLLLSTMISKPSKGSTLMYSSLQQGI